MEDIGRKLLEAREKLGLTLDEAERATRIRTHHLEALERGDIDVLPSPVQARGFLGNYADFLGLDVDSILLQYAESLQSRRTRSWPGASITRAGTQPSVQVHSRRPLWLSFDLFFATFFTLAVLSVLIWGGNRVMALIRQQPDATEVALSFLIPTPSPTLTSTPEAIMPIEVPGVETAPPGTPIPTRPIVLGLTSVVNLRILAEKRSWVRVVVDGEEVFSGRMKVGEEREFNGERFIEVVTGNGAGLRVFYSGQDQGVLGEVGQVVTRLWTLDGVQTPTPTITLTPTLTPPGAEAATPTLTTPLDNGGG